MIRPMPRLAAIVVLALAAAGCATRPGVKPTPAALSALPWGAISPTLEDGATLSEVVGALEAGPDGPRSYSVLALSGGGSRGAYAAGVLCGWTASGTRPRFTVVTGVSMGAVIATFAFLGPDYDDRLRELFTTLSTRDVYRRLGLLTTLSTGSLNGIGPLRRRLEGIIDDDVLDQVAAEHAAGRRLYVASTNLDEGRSVAWDLGAIAASARPDRHARYIDAICASFARPLQLEPVYIGVEVDGVEYSQMHVDGSLMAPIFLRPYLLEADASLYVLVGDVISVGVGAGRPVRASLRDILSANVRTMFQTSRRRSIYRAYVLADRRHARFNLAAVPDDYEPLPASDIFDPGQTTALFEAGYEAAARGTPWMAQPPGLAPGELLLPAP